MITNNSFCFFLITFCFDAGFWQISGIVPFKYMDFSIHLQS